MRHTIGNTLFSLQFIDERSRNYPISLIGQVKVIREKVTWPNATIRKANEGMPNYENNHVKGSLYITIDVAFPKDKIYSTEEKETLANLLATDVKPQEYNGLGGFKSAVL